MPQAAPATGCVDFVLPPEGSILAILHGARGIDSSLYREKMVKRRILRRLALRNIGGLAEYSEGLEKDSDESRRGTVENPPGLAECSPDGRGFHAVL